MKVSKNRQELLQNTVNFYNTSNRGMNGKDCCYISSSGKRCAIGRELSKKTAMKLASNSKVTSHVIFDELPKRLQSMGMSFLTRVQILHDERTHWDHKGITGFGKEYADRIVTSYNLKPLKYN